MEGAVLLAVGIVLSLVYTPAAQSQLLFTAEPQDTTVQEGESFSLSCRAALVDNPAVILMYTWQKEGNNSIIQQGDRYSVMQAGLQDTGVYICTVYDGTDILTSRNASVTVTEVESGLSQGEIIAIAVSLSVALVLTLVALTILCLWVLLCAHNANYWDKKPRQTHSAHVPSRRSSLAYGYLSDPKDVAGFAPAYAPKSVSKKRSKSLTHLFDEFDDPYKNLGSPSTEDLLSQSTHGNTGIEDYNRQLQEQLDKELLSVDESLFEPDQKPTKYKSESNLKPTESLVEGMTDHSRTIPIEDLSKRHRKQSDPFFMHKTRIKLTTTGGAGMDMDSRRSSLKSMSDAAQSDLSISDDDSGNQSGSLFKSVRFDLNEGDSYTDSGVATESSTPYHSGSSHDLERRASAPEIKKVHFSPRRGSAPECYHKPRAAVDEGIHEADSKDLLKDTDKDETMEDDDSTKEMSQAQESPLLNDTLEDNVLKSNQDDAFGDDMTTTPGVSEIASSFTNSEEKDFVFSAENESLKQMDQLRVHYNEQTEESLKSEHIQTNKDDINVPRDRVAEMRLKFLQRTGPDVEHTESTTSRKTHLISKLVSERTRKLMKRDKWDETKGADQFGSESVKYTNSTKAMSNAIPLFMPPVGLKQWQPKLLSDKRHPRAEPVKKPNDSDSDSSSSDDEMVEPMSPTKVAARMSPIGRGFSSRQPHGNFLTSPFGKQPRAEMPGLQSRKKPTSAGRLSSIPEESPTSLRSSS